MSERLEARAEILKLARLLTVDESGAYFKDSPTTSRTPTS